VRRVGDLIIACALVIFTSPFMAIVALAIKSDSSGPVFYRQERVGLNGRRFILLKFRSMVDDAEPDGRPVWASEHDVRITRVGRLIRCTRIDELPQLFNILCGDMSVIGPRPERPYFVDELTKDIRFLLSGIRLSRASMAGHKLIIGMVPQSKTLGKNLSYDLYYINNHNFALDLVILISTVHVAVSTWGAIGKRLKSPPERLCSCGGGALRRQTLDQVPQGDFTDAPGSRNLSDFLDSNFNSSNNGPNFVGFEASLGVTSLVNVTQYASTLSRSRPGPWPPRAAKSPSLIS
jgi:lipopolysaccharide/colanic/teichoic acid biosynthesis glycosyltransferase